ncbi:putative monovalent cation/H+ antiporter subunit A [Cesiribacter andamanensis]|uniref:Multiple resistance and pH homeostasis protein A n=1 Tax=Cesiribacter andamanensis AMV16 TaxID=1279009 RepID=M7MZJ0_9BACT|nr:putative monovalent cation/H+ antiporter subunit A [Cesiribacter andamanensis]EMR01838.1 Multiple resistance and pH homeostasis protein A [Cesiribacter andamanensis AMV16]
MVLALVAGLAVACAAPLIHRLAGSRAYLLLMLLPLSIFGYLLSLLPTILAGQVLSSYYPWVPSLGIHLDIYLDGLSLLFALLISGFGALIIAYAAGYLKGHPLLGRFYGYLIMFMVAMLGVVTAGNLFSLFVFWELTSLSSYLLIGFKHDTEDSRNSALQALLVTGGGGLALMGGFLLLSTAGGSLSLPELLEQGDLIRTHALYLPALALICLGAFTKSAQFPFHFWLPNAMAAPTPVSAYLHSATMVKAGVYLLARLTPVLGGTDPWAYSLLIVGGTTTVLGAFLAIQQSDLKAILAYTTISALGILVSMIGLGTAPALEAMVVFLLAHALYKGTLFMVAGNVDHATGSRQIKQLRGLGRHMRPTALAAALAALSMAGMLPFFGFIGKELLYEAALEESTTRWALFGLTFFSGIIFVAVALVLGYRIFWRKTPTPTPLLHADGPLLYLPPLLLAGLGLLLGVLPALLVTPMLRRAAEAMLGEAQTFELTLWHGVNLVLLLSGLTMLLGWVLYRATDRLHALAPRLAPLYHYGPNNLFFKGVKALPGAAAALTGAIQTGKLRNYIAVISLTLVGFVAYTLIPNGPPLVLADRWHLVTNVRLYEVVLILLILAALYMLHRSKSRLTSIAILGIIGYSIAVFFILFGAPDIAATQLLIETLTVVLFVLVLHKLPAFHTLSAIQQKPKYIAVSVLFGAAMTYVLLLVKQFPLDSPLKEYFGQASYLQGQGRNIVNVILVDFRALDTLGETTVLAVAAKGIFALFKLKLDQEERL